MSDDATRDMSKARCTDETEDDPWRWLADPSEDSLSEAMLEHRVRSGKWILKNFYPGAWTNHVAIDPCSSLLPRVPWRLEEMQVAAMGKMKWRSKRTAMEAKGSNGRAPATAAKQSGPSVLQVSRTPAFARCKLFIYVCDPDADGTTAPTKLNDPSNLACSLRS